MASLSAPFANIKPYHLANTGVMLGIVVAFVACIMAPGTTVGTIIGAAVGIGAKNTPIREHFRRLMICTASGLALGTVVDFKTDSFGTGFKPIPSISIKCPTELVPERSMIAHASNGQIRLVCE